MCYDAVVKGLASFRRNNVKELDVLKESLKKAENFRAAASYISFDMATIAPENAKPNEGELIAFLENEELKMRKDPSYVSALLSSLKAVDSMNEWERAMVLLAYRAYRMEKNIPKEEAYSFSLQEQRAFIDWEKAKDSADFSIFSDSLQKVIENNKKKAALRELDEEEKVLLKSDYDRLLDKYERGMTTEAIDPIFEESKERIVALLERIAKSKKKIRRDFLSRKVPIEKQRQISKMLQEVLHVDTTRSLIGESEHAFTDRMAGDDVRITTHYYEDIFLSNIYSVMHESGHLMFDMRQPKENHEYFITEGKTLGMHESVSRFYENRIGRSKSFISLIYPRLKEIIPETLSDVSERELYEAVNIAEPTLIRTEADEVTYTLHVIIRYELEKKLIGGELSVKELPKAWNEKYKDILGIVPSNDAEGVLQDVHWASDFGYFPTYAIGNFYNSMYYNEMAKEIDIDGAVRAGDIERINSWMEEKVYKKADRLTPAEWIHDITGRSLTPSDFLDYLDEKYKEIYEL